MLSILNGPFVTMATSQARERPVWKSTRPDNPAGASRPIPASLEADIHRFLVSSRPQPITVEALILQRSEIRRDPALNKVKQFNLLESVDGVSRVVALLKDSTESPEETFGCFTHVQAMSVHSSKSISNFWTDAVQNA
jgi:hypothetical protein